MRCVSRACRLKSRKHAWQSTHSMVRDYETGVGIEHADRVMGEREVFWDGEPDLPWFSGGCRRELEFHVIPP